MLQELLDGQKFSSVYLIERLELGYELITWGGWGGDTLGVHSHFPLFYNRPLDAPICTTFLTQYWQPFKLDLLMGYDSFLILKHNKRWHRLQNEDINENPGIACLALSCVFRWAKMGSLSKVANWIKEVVLQYLRSSLGKLNPNWGLLNFLLLCICSPRNHNKGFSIKMITSNL